LLQTGSSGIVRALMRRQRLVPEGTDTVAVIRSGAVSRREGAYRMRSDRVDGRCPSFDSARRVIPFLALALIVGSGCVGTLANLMNVAQGNTVPARYTGLKGKRVAVICVSNSEAFGPSYASQLLASQVGKLIEANVSDVTVVEPQKIAEWIDRNDWDYLDYKAVARGVKAEMVVAIDLDSFSLHEGKTLYKGRADVDVVVYDMTAQGKDVFTYSPTQIQFPQNAGHHTTDMSEEAFRRQFLSVVASRIARQFYPYDVKEDFARDASLIHSS
jgi:hypothetical protein